MSDMTEPEHERYNYLQCSALIIIEREKALRLRVLQVEKQFCLFTDCRSSDFEA